MIGKAAVNVNDYRLLADRRRKLRARRAAEREAFMAARRRRRGGGNEAALLAPALALARATDAALAANNELRRHQ